MPAPSGEESALPVSGSDPAPATFQLELPIEFETAVEMPDLTAGPPAEIWRNFFSQHRPAPRLVGRWVSRLHQEKQHAQVIACLEAALLRGQAQPWMYEVLALSMEIEGYPKASVERVVLSLADFGQADYASMMYSGAYLARLGRKPAALKMYRQAARLLPDRPEPYLLGLKLAQDAGDSELIAWAATGVLENAWGVDHARQQREAEGALLEEIRRQRQRGDAGRAEQLAEALSQARSRDLEIRLEWNGTADLDLLVEEPDGSVCSFESPLTTGGGIHLHDGIGPHAEKAYELYVNPRAYRGTYRITVRNAMGTLVGRRAVLTITRHSGRPNQSRQVRTLTMNEDEATLTFELEEGRRTTPRVLAQADVAPAGNGEAPRQVVPPRTPEQAQALREFARSRDISAQFGQARPVLIGNAPVVDVLRTGPQVSGQAVVSGDRRYVRIGIQPVFNEVTDIFTFSFLNSGP